MKGIRHLEEYINGIIESSITKKQKENPNWELNEETCDKINKALKSRLIKTSTIKIRSDNMVPVLKSIVPGMKLFTSDQKREALHKTALNAYIDSLVNLYGAHDKYSEMSFNPTENLVFRMLNKDEQEKYAALHAQTKTGYYKDQMLPKGDMDSKIQEAERGKAKLALSVIEKVINEQRETILKNFSDTALIKAYPSIAPSLKLIPLAHKLLDDIMANHFADIPQKKLKGYEEKLLEMMPVASKLENRMALMADPYYATINLEMILDANTLQLANLNENLAPRLDANMEQDNRVHDEDNIFNLASDILNTRYIELKCSVLSYMGISMDNTDGDFKDRFIICDKNGKTLDHQKSLYTLRDIGDPIYVIDKYGDRSPVPVLYDAGRPDSRLLVGEEAIVDAQKYKPVEPTVGGWWKFINGFGIKSKAMEKYKEQKAKYDREVKFNSVTEAMLNNKTAIPSVVQDVCKPYNTKYQNIVAREAEREKTVSDSLVVIGYITEDRDGLFLDTLSKMIVSKALCKGSEPQLHNTVCKLFGIFKEEKYKEDNERRKLIQHKSFKEFAWNIRQDKTLMEKIKSGDADKANEALKEICDRFALHFRNGFEGITVSKDFEDKLHAEEKARGQAESLGKNMLMTESKRASIERLRDNGSYWNTVLSMYGGERRLRPDWLFTDLYTIKDWQMMQKSKVDITSLKPGNESIDEKTFAALGMMLTLSSKSELATMTKTRTFEEMTVRFDGPRENASEYLGPIVEPNRAKLIKALNNMGTEYQVDGSNISITGKDHLAKDLAVALSEYADRANTYNFHDRKDSLLSQVAGKVMAFAEKHDMMGLLVDNGLAPEQLDTIRISIKLGEITNNAFNAEADLLCDHQGDKKLSPEERLDRINKIMLLKAAQADLESNKDAKEYSDDMKSILKDNHYLETLSRKMMSDSTRQTMANDGSATFYNETKCETDDRTRAWGAYIKEARKLAEEAPYKKNNQEPFAKNANIEPINNSDQVQPMALN